MSNNPAPTPSDTLSGAKGVPEAVKASLHRQADGWLQAHGQLLDAMQTLATGWFHRRRKGVEATHAAAIAICECDDAVTAARCYQDWVRGSIERMAADVLALQSEALWLVPTLAKNVASASINAAPFAGTSAEVEHKPSTMRGETSRVAAAAAA